VGNTIIMNRLSLAISAAYASAITIASMAIITIWAELSPQFKNILKSWSGHHWRTKSYLTVAIFIVCTVVLYSFFKRRQSSPRFAIMLVIIIALIGSVAVTGFYILHFLGA